jgi:hypothetical protein
MRVPSTRANGVGRCGRTLAREEMCRRITPRAKSASPISDRWQRNGAPSAHMTHARPARLIRRSSSKPRRKSTVSM